MRLNREPAFPKCCDFWVSQGRQLLLGVVTNWALKVFQPLWETLLTGHTVLEREERSLKPLGVFPGLPMQEKIPFSPREICSPCTQPLGKKKGHITALGGKCPVPPQAFPLLHGGSSPGRDESPGGRGSFPLGRAKLQDADPWRMLSVCEVLQALRRGCLWLSNVPTLPDPCSGFPDDPSWFPPVPVPLPAHGVHQGPGEAGGG